jgi:hypothetical protein
MQARVNALTRLFLGVFCAYVNRHFATGYLPPGDAPILRIEMHVPRGFAYSAPINNARRRSSNGNRIFVEALN